MRKLLAASVMVLALSCVFGTSSEADADTMVASYYGPGFEGNITASGDVFEPYSEYTCAHRTLPFGTYLLVIYQGESVVCEVTDRGPYVYGRDLDLSYLAAEEVGLIYPGVAIVDVIVLR